MVTNLRDAKGRLSELVQLASQGEEVVITVRGKACARIVAMKADAKQTVSREQWARELSAAANAAKAGPLKMTDQTFWDDLRHERE